MAKSCLALGLGALVGCSAESGTPAGRKPRVKVATVAAGTLHPRERLWGEVAAPPGRDALLGSLEGGYLALYRVAEGDLVHQGDALVEIASGLSRGEVAAERARLTEAEAKAGAARAREARAGELLSRGAASSREAEGAQAEARMSEAAAAGARASVELALKRLARTQIRSPIDGQVVRLLASPGEAVPPGSRPLIEVADTQTLEVRATASAEQARRIRIGQAVALELIDPGIKVNGSVVAISPRVDPGGAVSVRISMADRPPDLRLGQFASADIDVGEATGILVPAGAIQEISGAPLPYVIVLDGAAKASRKTVELGPRAGNLVAVRSGLKEGDRIVVSGGYGLPDGAEVDPEQ